MNIAGIVLAGGAASRLSGVDKAMLVLDGIPLLHRVVRALGEAPVVVVGPVREGLRDVVWTREDPPGSGPVAGLAAGLAVLPGCETVVVLAGDLAGVSTSTVDKLVAAIGPADGAVLVDSGGRRQWLISAWRLGRLRAAMPAEPGGASLWRVLGGLAVVEVAESAGESADVDTPADLDRLTHSSQPRYRPSD